MMVSSYAYTLLTLSLTVHFHWLASESASAQAGSEEKQQREQEAMLMRSHRYFLDDGLPLLVSMIRRSVEKLVFGAGDNDNDDDDDDEDILNRSTTNGKSSSLWKNPSTQFVSSTDIEGVLYRQLPRLLDDIGMGSSRQGFRRRRRRRNWIRYVLPDEEIFDPLWDICKSPVWEDAQEQVLEYLWYKTLRDGEFNNNKKNSHGWGKVFGTNGDNHQTKQEQQPQQSLAKVMAHFKKASSALFEEFDNNEEDGFENGFRDYTRKTTVERLQTLPTVLELGDITFQQ